MQYAKIAAFAAAERMNPTGAIASDSRARAIADLFRAIQGLRRHLDSPAEQADLYLIEEALTRLAQPRAPVASGIADFDAQRLGHLLQITGPELASELLSRLVEDLTTTLDMLLSGAEASDWKHLREGSHVLISLSGSVGALSLQAMAESLNAMAHQQDREGLAVLMPPLVGELNALIRLIRDRQISDGFTA